MHSVTPESPRGSFWVHHRVHFWGNARFVVEGSVNLEPGLEGTRWALGCS